MISRGLQINSPVLARSVLTNRAKLHNSLALAGGSSPIDIDTEIATLLLPCEVIATRSSSQERL